jgi:hypothetical protein
MKQAGQSQALFRYQKMKQLQQIDFCETAYVHGDKGFIGIFRFTSGPNIFQLRDAFTRVTPLAPYYKNTLGGSFGQLGLQFKKVGINLLLIERFLNDDDYAESDTVA